MKHLSYELKRLSTSGVDGRCAELAARFAGVRLWKRARSNGFHCGLTHVDCTNTTTLAGPGEVAPPAANHVAPPGPSTPMMMRRSFAS
jgi:hypothetical protein